MDDPRGNTRPERVTAQQRMLFSDGLDEAAFTRCCAQLHEWTRWQMDLCGGWLPELDAIYRPRVVGCFQFDQPEVAELETMAAGLYQLYRHMGSTLGCRLAECSAANDWDWDAFSPPE